MNRTEIILASASKAIEEGHVLHVMAQHKPGSRKRRTYALPAVDITVGPDATRGGYLVVDYSRVKSGVEDHFEDEVKAIHAVRRVLGWDRVVEGLGAALVRVRVYGAPERTDWSKFQREAQERSDGARMRAFAESRPPLRGPLFGPMG